MTTYEVVDADAHYFETLDHIAPYLDEPWKTRLSQKIDSPQSSIYPTSSGDRNVFGRISRDELSLSEMTPEDIPMIMDHLDVDKTIILSQKMLSFGRIKGDDERPEILANGYVDYMLDKVVDPDEGIYTMIPAPYQDPEAAADLIYRVGDEDGICGVCLVTPGAEPPMGNRAYDVIYEAAEKEGLALNFHAGGGGLDEFHLKGYEKFLETHTLGFLMNNMAQLTSVVVQGVPEKFPDLEIAFQESGIFWVPLMMRRLDAEYLKRPSEAPLLEKRPSEYIKEFYFGIQPLEVPENEAELEAVIDTIGGASQLMYASDYPHWDYDLPEVISERPFLSDDEKARILSGTANEVFGL
ncbi:amidohydrolase family protein [Natrarchaeobius oligotrophus]|uniref:Amidohydrolase n=1 Tax=Natrarchaeobius chitinivorans TaxID=1679083 RepID=A0A3N6PS66_NATCH|nr:amidohydrolase family protein [Natrarchaeobius chitinivorans]RQH02326.1 amidohydrolase [Natrarchaeobius chitinivorans]